MAAECWHIGRRRACGTRGQVSGKPSILDRSHVVEWKAPPADGEVQPSVAPSERGWSTPTGKAALRLISENEEQPQFTSHLHKVVTAPWLAFVHNEPVDEGTSTQLLSYLTAGVLWAFAAVVGCMTVAPI
jgi:hypothetical protein